jgi:hypothetical protein
MVAPIITNAESLPGQNVGATCGRPLHDFYSFTWNKLSGLFPGNNSAGFDRNVLLDPITVQL